MTVAEQRSLSQCSLSLGRMFLIIVEALRMSLMLANVAEQHGQVGIADLLCNHVHTHTHFT